MVDITDLCYQFRYVLEHLTASLVIAICVTRVQSDTLSLKGNSCAHEAKLSASNPHE